ncbi:MAG TPA: hypothetical protein VER55_06155 [Ardenticatenaceae bacterium]|nr:hypothetical protein [Ardenticatenaceae bacterium]
MSLVVGKRAIEINEVDFVDAEGALEAWQSWPASTISHHGRPCCDIARQWLLSMDHSQLGGGNVLAGPRWVRHKYKWGPSPWPIHWCEAVRRKTLDCGALAHIAHEIFSARGVQSFPAQLIQQFSEDATRDWSERWKGETCAPNWIREDLIYHEGCAIVAGGHNGPEIKLWDASAGWWINPRQYGGYSGLLAVRIFDARPEPDKTLRWDTHTLQPNVWQKLQRPPRDFA